MKAYAFNYSMGECQYWYIVTDWPPVSDPESIHANQEDPTYI